MKMKKYWKAAMVCAAFIMTGALAACGTQKDENTQESSEQSGTTYEVTDADRESVVLSKMDVDKYVTLGDYKNIRVKKEAAKVNEKDLNDLVDNVYLSSFPADLGVKDRAVEVGDTANIDYVGKKDGVAFDGGTAEGSNLTIGSHTFIDGFEDGLVGVMPGETVDLNLTFPEGYHNADLAGQAVVFTVTVNYIIPAEKMDKAVENFGVETVNTVEELRQYVYDYLEMLAQQDADTAFEQQVLDAFLDCCEFHDITEGMYAVYRENIKNNMATIAKQQGTDAETYVYYNYGMDMNTFLTTYADEALKQNIAMQAIANREGFTLTDEQLDGELVKLAEENGYESVEALMGNSSIEEFREYFMYNTVYDYLMENAAK